MNIYDITGTGPSPKKNVTSEAPSTDPALDDMDQFDPSSSDIDGVADPIAMRTGTIDDQGFPTDMTGVSTGDNVPGTPIVPIKVTKNIDLDLGDIVDALDVEEIGNTKGINVDLDGGDSLPGVTVGGVDADDNEPEWLQKLKVLAGIPTEIDGSDLQVGMDVVGDDKGIQIIKPF